MTVYSSNIFRDIIYKFAINYENIFSGKLKNTRHLKYIC